MSLDIYEIKINYIYYIGSLIKNFSHISQTFEGMKKFYRWIFNYIW